MPPVIAAVAVAVANAAGSLALTAFGSITAAAWVSTAVFYTVEVGLTIGLMMATAALFAPKLPHQEGARPLKTSIGARQVVLGEARVGGVYAFYESTRNSRFSSQDVLYLCEGPIQGITHYYLSDQEVTLTNGVVNSPGHGLYGNGDVQIQTRLGLATETAYPQPVTDFAGVWTNNCRGDGCASLWLGCRQGRKVDHPHEFPNGVPEPSVALEGLSLWDPRQNGILSMGDPSTWLFTRNPALFLAFYLTSLDKGMGLDYAQRLLPTVDDLIAAASVCDQVVAKADGSSEARYAAGGMYRLDTEPAEVITQILASFDGHLAMRGDGAFVIRAGQYEAPTVVLTDDHVLAYTVHHFQTDEEAVNQLIPRYTDPGKRFNVADGGAWTDTADVESRGRLRSQPFDLVWVQSASQARRLAKRQMSRLTAELRGQIRTNLYGANVLGERYIRLQIAENRALRDIVVEVGKIEIDLTGDLGPGFLIDWTEADPNIDEWSTSEELPADGAPASRPDAGDLPTPSITSIQVTYPKSTSSDQGAQLIITISVPAPWNQNSEWTMRWRVTGQDDSAWSESTYSDIDLNPPVKIQSGFVPGQAELDIEVAFETAGGISPWSAIYNVTTNAPNTAFVSAVKSAAGTVKTLPYAGAITAPALVNVFTTGGVAQVQLADAASKLEANGYVLDSGAAASSNAVYFSGEISGLSGLTPGATYYLGAAGGISAAPPAAGTVQTVGKATSATTLQFAAGSPTDL